MKNKKNVLCGLIILLAGVFYFPVLAQQKKSAQDVVYQLDVKKSKLFWKAPKNRHNGFILFNSGTLSNIVAGWPTRGTFNINMNSMRSIDKPTAGGRKNVDDKLSSEDFFAVSRYPTATMLVKQILPEKNTAATYRVSGELTIKGVTKPIEFATIMKQNGSTITATANTNISRANWNINHQPQPTSWDFFARMKDNLVDDDISVSLELVFAKKQL
ncbi:YceI-like domain-containing protein [Mucilaginibacter frigoritolerans]|uniref:YceI-like domain-containing protein n=1 Tax=Mucilaginibacter frigoritolerans TaxID=652788 RepID=A0A562U501_9SPHI|nr:YceI family protein [Mucilaginibacter frigoritolerans]TWJ00916.1 YceI-like domain-containing protein [Mucilaginibacter frigoritolerans]